MAIVVIYVLLQNNLSGTYEGMSDYGIPVTMTFSNGNVETDILGFSVNGKYEVSGNYVTITLRITVFGFTQVETITGRIDGNSIIFSDLILTKR